MNRFLRDTVIGLAAASGAVAVALSYERQQVMKPPKGNLEEFLLRGRSSSDQRVVVCVGASTVHGRISVDFVDLLRRRFPAAGYAFVNAGLNGDLAYNVLQRLEPVIACDPDFVVVLVGTNDVQSTLSQSTGRLAMRSKQLPCAPSLEWYRENLTAIVTQLKQRTRARVALCSLPILGEDLLSPANLRVREFNAAIKQAAEAQGVIYVPVHECQAEYLTRANHARGREFTGTPTLVVAAGIQHYLLGQSLDDISYHNGLVLTTDLMHMNSQGACIIADQIAARVLS